MTERGTSPEDRIMTPANVVTLVRICLVPVFVLALLSPWPEWLGLGGLSHKTKSLVAAGIFILISCTDWIDGYLARSRGEVTNFGKFMDPLADKILVAAALLALVELSVLPSWPVLIILVREFIVSGVRMIAATKGEVIAASWYGKAKTVFQIIAIVLFIVKDSLYLPTVSSVLDNPLYIVSWAVMIIALVLTVVSMLDYLVKARHLLGFSRASSLQPEEASAELDAEVLREDIQAKAREVIEAARARGVTLGTAESLTGGLIAASLTDVPGSSSVVRGGVVSYVNDVKSSVLGVDPDDLARNGAVTEQTARSMAEGARATLDVDVAVAVTGIAGPGGAEPSKPVGTVWFAVAAPDSTRAFCRCFAGNRELVRLQTVYTATVELLEATMRSGR